MGRYVGKLFQFFIGLGKFTHGPCQIFRSVF